jgi:hypothetical protein
MIGVGGRIDSFKSMHFEQAFCPFRPFGSKLSLLVTPTALTNFKVNGPSQTCTTAGCTFTWTVAFRAPALPIGQILPDIINFAITAADISGTPNLTSALTLIRK